jgi:hypothetical protein
MNPFEFVIAIIVITGVFSLIRHRMGARHRWEGADGEGSQEALRLREEVKELKERLKVLERITVDKENSLAKEIESLRDR